VTSKYGSQSRSSYIRPSTARTDCLYQIVPKSRGDLCVAGMAKGPTADAAAVVRRTPVSHSGVGRVACAVPGVEPSTDSYP
jgi:hypothetical protein